MTFNARDYAVVAKTSFTSAEERERAEEVLALCADKPIRKLTPMDFADGALKPKRAFEAYKTRENGKKGGMPCKKQ